MTDQRPPVGAAGLSLLMAGILVACGDTAPKNALPKGASSTIEARAPAPAVPTGTASAEASARGPVPPPGIYDENDFTASDRNRDPFRSFAETPAAARALLKTNLPQRQVAADRFALDDLKLVAIVKGSTVARVMLVDPEGKGWIVSRGEFIGRPESFRQSGAGGTEYELNWKVDRIREGDVVLVREEPGAGNGPAATRVLALRPDGETETKGK